MKILLTGLAFLAMNAADARGGVDVHFVSPAAGDQVSQRADESSFAAGLSPQDSWNAPSGWSRLKDRDGDHWTYSGDDRWTRGDGDGRGDGHEWRDDDYHITAAPEPSTWLLMVAGVSVLTLARMRLTRRRH